MPARAPLDVDLEDKLLYGLTPMRLGYAALAFLGAFALWSSRWAATPVRGAASLVVVIAGATLAWGRWRGRAVDGWLADIAAFVIRTRRVAWNERLVDRLSRLSRRVTSRVHRGKSKRQEEVPIDSSEGEFQDAAIATR